MKRVRLGNRKDISIMLDSGVFSIWKSGFAVDIDDYIRCLEDNHEHVDHYINFDVIPGGLGRAPTQLELEDSASRGWDNMKYIELHGFKPLPVFHAGERFYWLDKMVGEGYPYICISPSYIRNVKARMEWFDQVYARLCDKDGYPVVDTHILGLTALAPLYRYPWTSCDSTSWMLSAAFGAATLPDLSSGEPNYGSRIPHNIVFSSKAKVGTNHFKALGKREQALIEDFVRTQGTTTERLAEYYIDRMMLNVRFMLKAEKLINVERFTDRGIVLRHMYSHNKGFKITNRRVIFSLAPYNGFSLLLNEEGVKNRLWSFFLLQKEHPDFLEHYKRTGLMYGHKAQFDDLDELIANKKSRLAA